MAGLVSGVELRSAKGQARCLPGASHRTGVAELSAWGRRGGLQLRALEVTLLTPARCGA